MVSQAAEKKGASVVEKRRKARTGKCEHCNAGASISFKHIRRGEKTSRYVGVKVRGKHSISIEFRHWSTAKRITAAYFASQEQAAMAHDLARRLFVDEKSYLKLREGKLNFWKESAFLNQFFKDNDLEKFVGKDEWDQDMATLIRELATRALLQMDIERGLRTGLPSSYENSRESLAAISKRLAELELKDDAISQPKDSDPGWEEVNDATTTPPEVHEAEVEQSSDTQQKVWQFGNITVDDYFWEIFSGWSLGDDLFAKWDEGLTIALTNP